MKFNIVIVTWNRVNLLKKLISNLKDFKEFSLCELIIVINGEDKKSSEFLETSQIKNLEFFQISSTTPASARNEALKKCREEFILFLDDDLTLPGNYFIKAFDIIYNYPNVVIFGGPDKMRPTAKDNERCFSYALETPFTTGPTVFRHITRKGKAFPGKANNLILCNLWVKKEIAQKKFNPHYKRNEETHFLKENRIHAENILHVPDLYVYHKRKSEIREIMRTYFISGIYRLKTSIELPIIEEIFFYFPLFLFLFSLCFGIWQVFVIYLSLSFLWFLIIQKGSKKIHLYPKIFFIQCLILGSYYLGVLNFPFRKKTLDFS
jgi:glycosyltransferase involved in cell wall biosynthesis